MAQQDTLYAQSRRLVDAFRFDADVADVFSDMVRRSVPGYPLILDMLGVLSAETLGDNALCYDLGCSFGASTLAIRQNMRGNNGRIIAIDNSEEMANRCRQSIAHDSSTTPVDVVCQDILKTEFKPCDLVSINLTLQFIEPQHRLDLLSRIAAALSDNGVLFLAEKICFDDPIEQEKLTDLHHQFKKHQGYSDLEIAQKRTAIENVLIPDTLATHQQRLLAAGFKKVIVAFQCFNFIALIAYK